MLDSDLGADLVEHVRVGDHVHDGAAAKVGDAVGRAGGDGADQGGEDLRVALDLVAAVFDHPGDDVWVYCGFAVPILLLGLLLLLLL